MDPNGKLPRETMMSNSTKDNSEQDMQGVGAGGPTIENPNADLELSPEELEEIYGREYMEQGLAIDGAQPGSNQIKDTETALVDSKYDKLLELMKANTEV